MFTMDYSHMVCFGNACVRDDTFVEMVIVTVLVVLFAMPILLALV